MRQEFQQLSWVEKLIGVGLIIGAILVGRGTLQLVNEKDAEAPKKLAAAVGAFLVIVALAALFFGKASVERFFQDVHQAGSNYANRVESPQNHSRSAQEVRCGPGKMHDGVATRRQPLRIMRPLECTLTLQKDVGVAAQIRYNNEPNWLLWPANGPSPIAQRIVRTFEVRPLNTETVYVVANFRHLR